MLGGDNLGLADALGISQFAFCGLSLGGAIGRGLRSTHPGASRISCWPTPRPSSCRAAIGKRIAAVLKGGISAIVDLAMHRLFLRQRWRKTNPMRLRSGRSCQEPIRWDTRRGRAALRAMDHGDLLRTIQAPTWRLSAIMRREVEPLPTGHGERAKSWHSRFQGHSFCFRCIFPHIERPRSFTTALLEFRSTPGCECGPPARWIRSASQCPG